MTTTTLPTAPISRAASRTGTVLTVLLTLFLLFDCVTKLLQLDAVVSATVQMGFPAWSVPVIGAVLAACLALYLVPGTSLLGAVLLTGYLGGAVCAQLRIEAPLFSTRCCSPCTPASSSGWRCTCAARSCARSSAPPDCRGG